MTSRTWQEEIALKRRVSLAQEEAEQAYRLAQLRGEAPEESLGEVVAQAAARAKAEFLADEAAQADQED